MLRHITLAQLRHVLHLLASSLEEQLRAHPDRLHTIGELANMVANPPEDVAEAERALTNYIDELGYDATCELVAVMYFGRDGTSNGQDNLVEWFNYVKKTSPNLDAAASCLEKAQVVQYIAVGLARIGGLT
jgi:hypothetical protein